MRKRRAVAVAMTSPRAEKVVREEGFANEPQVKARHLYTQLYACLLWATNLRIDGRRMIDGRDGRYSPRQHEGQEIMKI